MIRRAAYLLSVVFHPLLILSYMLVILLIVNPYSFGYRSIWEADILLMLVFLSSFLIPMITVLFMRFLGLIESIHLPKRQDRIGPLIATGIFYVPLYYHILKANRFPDAFVIFTLGVVIALFIGFFINNFTKISLHALGMGGLVSMGILTLMYFSYSSFSIGLPSGRSYEITTILLLYGIVLVAGLVCTARLLLKAHSLQDIYGGFTVGFFSQLIAFIILQ